MDMPGMRYGRGEREEGSGAFIVNSEGIIIWLGV